jgi:hypothetical protein
MAQAFGDYFTILGASIEASMLRYTSEANRFPNDLQLAATLPESHQSTHASYIA